MRVLIVLACAGLCAFLIHMMIENGLERAGLWAVPLSAVATFIAAAAALWPLIPKPVKLPVSAGLQVPRRMIRRPAETGAAVKALRRRRPGKAGITVELRGEGGFGKTTLAYMVRADRRVRRRFGGRIFFVTMGRDIRDPAAIAGKVNEVIKRLSGEQATFTDPQLAGERLGSLLSDAPRSLIVVDDVWAREQLTPFLRGGRRCARLVTTRVSGLLADDAVPVDVDQMLEDEADRLLKSGLRDLDPGVAAELLTATGRWPLLLELVNKLLTSAQDGTDVSAYGKELARRLRTVGPAFVDGLAADPGQDADPDRPGARVRGVRATIQASTSLLSSGDAERLAELGVFAEDETIPLDLVTRLWGVTAALDGIEAVQVCRRLSSLSLISRPSGASPGISLHDVIRDFLRAELGPERIVQLNTTLLEAAGAALPTGRPAGGEGLRQLQKAWWDLGDENQYLWDHLAGHLIDAGRHDEAEATVCDLRWAAARLQRSGPAAVVSDLAAAGSVRAGTLRVLVTRAAHLLGPTSPSAAVTDILFSRIADDPDWGPQADALRGASRRPRLVNRWPLLDLPDPALIRVWAADQPDEVLAVTAASDGLWLATGSADGTVRIRNLAGGRSTLVPLPRARKPGRPSPRRITAMAADPKGLWLASASADGTVRILEAATGRQRKVMIAYTRRDIRSRMSAVAIAPDGRWIVGGSTDGLVRRWTVASGFQRGGHIYMGHPPVGAVAISGDSSWVAWGGGDGSVTVLDAVGRSGLKAKLTGHSDRITALATGGEQLISGSLDGTIRIWDTATWQQLAVLGDAGIPVRALALETGGKWLASAGDDGLIRIWDPATWQEQHVLRGHSDRVTALAVTAGGTRLLSGSRDGTARLWDMAALRPLQQHTPRSVGITALSGVSGADSLVSLGHDGSVRSWDAAGHEQIVVPAGNDEVTAVAAGPLPDGGSWIAAARTSGMIQVIDPADRRKRVETPSGTSRIPIMATAPEGTQMITVSDDGIIAIWDTQAGRQVIVLNESSGTCKHGRARRSGRDKGNAARGWPVAVSPDGKWLATGASDGCVTIWNTVTWRRQATLPRSTPSEAVRAIAIAPDATWVAVAHHVKATGIVKEICIWNTATWKPRQALDHQRGDVTALISVPDGKSLITGTGEGTIRLWDIATGDMRVLMRVDGAILALTWLSADTLAVGGTAGLYLFDFEPA